MSYVIIIDLNIVLLLYFMMLHVVFDINIVLIAFSDATIVAIVADYYIVDELYYTVRSLIMTVSVCPVLSPSEVGTSSSSSTGDRGAAVT